MTEFVPIRKLTLQEIKSATEVDAELQALAFIITQGWPERRADVPSQLQFYFSFREELSIQDGVVFKEERIEVPSSLRQCMMDKVHASHLGIQGCLRRAKEAFYWPGIFGEPKKPSTGQASTSKSQNSSQGAAFATATNQSSRNNL